MVEANSDAGWFDVKPSTSVKTAAPAEKIAAKVLATAVHVVR
jgi:hypothetical protein